MELEAAVLERVRAYGEFSRWERSELGRDLRRLGLSYGEIMELVPVKKSTLATWCREIQLSLDQLRALKERRPSTVRGVPRDTHRKRRREIELIRAQALLEAEHLLADPFWVAGVALYWGEGTKSVRRLALANADAAALRLFKQWSECYLPPNDGWRGRLNLHANNDEPAARAWWADQLGVPVSDFTKSYIKPDGTGHRKNTLEYGVCTLIKRRSGNAYQSTMAWIEFLQDLYGGYD
jgi:hypothetical protein